jgi:hypothetical protein
VIGMKKADKIVPYIMKGLHKEELVNDVRFEIRGTKQEETFAQFSRPDSTLYKLCEIASEDPLLELFFFLKPRILYKPLKDYPITLEYPLIFNFDNEFLGSLLDEPMKTKIEDVEKRKEDAEKSVKDFSSRAMWKFFSVAVGDKQVTQRLKRKKLYVKEEEINDLFSSLVTRHRKQFEGITKDLIDIFGSLYYSLEYYSPLIEAFKVVKEAKENLEFLSFAYEKANDLGKQLSLSLAKLIAQRIFRVTTHSICMECVLKKELEPFSVIMKYPMEPDFPSRCTKCGGKTIFHTISIEAPYTFGPLFEENRLPEFIVGFSLARSEEIKKLYIHKKIQVLTKEGPSPGQQLNIFAISRENKILIVEITTSKDLNRILENFNKKIEALKGFPYDGLAFITPSPMIKEYPRFNKARIFGAKHLPKIWSHVEFFIQESSEK